MRTLLRGLPVSGSQGTRNRETASSSLVLNTLPLPGEAGRLGPAGKPLEGCRSQSLGVPHGIVVWNRGGRFHGTALRAVSLEDEQRICPREPAW
jgi:hypothetical protein